VISHATSDVCQTDVLFQRLSVVILRDNSVSVSVLNFQSDSSSHSMSHKFLFLVVWFCTTQSEK